MRWTLNRFIRQVDKLALAGCRFRLLGLAMFSHCALLEKLVRGQISRVARSTFPLRDRGLEGRLERLLHMRAGQELALPLVLTDIRNLDSVERVIRKTGRLVQLNIRLFNRLASFTKDMEALQQPVAATAAAIR